MAGLALCTVAFALDPQRPLRDYRVSEWQTPDGLPYPTIAALAQSLDGYLWVGTRIGLSRFDGVTFTSYNSENLPQLTTDRITALCAASDGTLWVGTAQGILWYRDGAFTRPKLGADVDTAEIFSLSQVRDGEVLIGSGQKLMRYRDDTCTEIVLANGASLGRIDAVRKNATGELLLAGRGVYRQKDGELQSIAADLGLANVAITSLATDQANAFWIGSQIGLNSTAGSARRTFSTLDGLPASAIRSLCIDHDQTLWVGTSNGLARYTDGAFQQLTIRGGETLSHVLCIFEDREDNLWVGTDNGLFRVQDVKVSNLTQRDGLSVNATLSVLETRDGARWVGTLGGGLAKITDQGIQIFRINDGLAQDGVGTLAEDAAGGLWIGYYTRGVSYLKDGQFTHYTPGGSPVRTRGLAIDRQGIVWAVNSTGLFHLIGGQFQRVPIDPALTELRALHVDRHNGIWVGGTSMIGLLRDGRWTLFPIKEKNIQSIFSDSDGDIWVLHDGPALMRIHGGVAETFESPSELGPLIYAGFERDGELWVDFRAGIARIPLSGFTPGLKSFPPYTLFNEADGMRSLAPNNPGSPGAVAMRDGSLWFCTSAGVAVIHPDRIRINRQPPTVIIEHVLADKREIARSNLNRAPPGRGELTFRFTAPSLVNPAKVRFRYRLIGFDTTWIDAGRTREAHYGGLSPGAYRFEVVACNNEGVWSPIAATCDVTLSPHFYQRWWFYAAIGLAVGGATVALLQWRERRLSRRALDLQIQNADLERRIAARTGELRSSYEALRASEYFYHSLVESLPHVIVRKDATGRYTYANGAFAELLGRPLDQIIGRTDDDLYPPELAANIKSSDQRILQQRQPMESEDVYRKPDGARRYLHVKKVPLYDERKQPLGVQVLLWDMTEFRETEDKLKSAQQEIAEISRLAGIAEMATGVLHNLGNALTSVKVSASLAIEGAQNSSVPRLRRVSEMLAAESHRLGDFFTTDERGTKLPNYLGLLTEQLEKERSALQRELEGVAEGVEHVAQIVSAQEENARVVGHTEEVSAVELIEYACRLTEASLLRKDVTVVREYIQVPRVRVQRQKTIQILAGLVRNALEALVEHPRPDKRLTLGVQCAPDGHVELSVSDNGPGIATENLMRVFQFGFTSKKDGHGYGLHSSAIAAIEMGGSLRVTSEGLGKGATFVLALPAMPAA